MESEELLQRVSVLRFDVENYRFILILFGVNKRL